MPLVKSKSKKAFKANVRTLMNEIGKSPHVQSRRQALAIAYSVKRRGKANGGPNLLSRNPMESMVLRGSSYGLRHEGMINSSIPGRTDKLPMNVKSGSYILPADIPSALGQGNTMAGGEILKKMFSSGPYGLPTPKIGGGRGGFGRMFSMPRMPISKTRGFQAGGDTGDDHVPIIAAGGEFIIHPDVVRDIGHGNINAGHKVLDKFVLQVRKKNIKTLQGLKPPKK
jgi:hypothetical protein